MSHFVTSAVYWSVALIVGILPAADELEVHLDSGSVRTGKPDPSTSESTLRLRVGDSDGYVTFGIDWNEIAMVRTKTQVWTPDHFAALRNELAELQRQSHNEDVDATVSSPRDESVEPPSVRPLWLPPARPGPSESNSPRVQFIELDAVAANWDQDWEWDGLVVRVWPMDQWGQVPKVPATLTVSLLAETSYGSPYSFDQLGHWVRAVRPGDYGRDGVSFRLRFQNFHPEQWDATGDPDRWIAPFGTVSASLSAPSHGVFRATSTTPVRIRRFSPDRDRLFLRSGWHRSGLNLMRVNP